MQTMHLKAMSSKTAAQNELSAHKPHETLPFPSFLEICKQQQFNLLLKKIQSKGPSRWWQKEKR
jgi:hypothetical protein